MDLVGLETEAESTTSDGSIDIVIKTEDYIYVIELKYDKSADEALKQIEDKKYFRKFQADDRRIIEIGVNFSSETRRIEDWKTRTV
ncbi:MAG: PD-(D/E)XK nuclease domain-containing protein [Muribaculaceae bacterium]|nr:PD-(D/E)XK nuclease domain-containing protein [Muribaculaceae bacterium]